MGLFTEPSPAPRIETAEARIAELEWRGARGAFVCPTCGAAYSILLGGYLGEG